VSDRRGHGRPGAAPEVDALAARARDAVDAEAVLRRTVELVRIRSVWDPETGADEAAAAAYVADELRALSLSVTVDEVAPGRPNVIADWAGAAFEPGVHRTLMLEGHTDVVTEGDRGRWTRDPYGADLEPDPAGGTRLYGRGSADMKAGVAAAIEAVAALQRAAPDLPGRVRLGIVVDEEGMMLGIKRFVAGGWADEVDGAIVCEPEELELCLHQKGAMRLHVHVRGVMAHGAMPYAGVNPIAGLQRFLAAVEALQDEEQARLGAHPFLGFPWLTPTIVRAPVAGEAQLNVMPDTAYAALDVRTVPGQVARDALRTPARRGGPGPGRHAAARDRARLVREPPVDRDRRRRPAGAGARGGLPGRGGRSAALRRRARRHRRHLPARGGRADRHRRPWGPHDPAPGGRVRAGRGGRSCSQAVRGGRRPVPYGHPTGRRAARRAPTTR
jgi:succinyl-diaminopimelate desuccinylase